MFVQDMVIVFHQIIVHDMKNGFLKIVILQCVMEFDQIISQFVQETEDVVCQIIVFAWMDIQEMIVQ